MSTTVVFVAQEAISSGLKPESIELYGENYQYFRLPNNGYAISGDYLHEEDFTLIGVKANPWGEAYEPLMKFLESEDIPYSVWN